VSPGGIQHETWVKNPLSSHHLEGEVCPETEIKEKDLRAKQNILEKIMIQTQSDTFLTNIIETMTCQF